MRRLIEEVRVLTDSYEGGGPAPHAPVLAQFARDLQERLNALRGRGPKGWGRISQPVTVTWYADWDRQGRPYQGKKTPYRVVINGLDDYDYYLDSLEPRSMQQVEWDAFAGDLDSVVDESVRALGGDLPEMQVTWDRDWKLSRGRLDFWLEFAEKEHAMRPVASASDARSAPYTVESRLMRERRRDIGTLDALNKAIRAARKAMEADVEYVADRIYIRMTRITALSPGDIKRAIINGRKVVARHRDPAGVSAKLEQTLEERKEPRVPLGAEEDVTATLKKLGDLTVSALKKSIKEPKISGHASYRTYEIMITSRAMGAAYWGLNLSIDLQRGPKPEHSVQIRVLPLFGGKAPAYYEAVSKAVLDRVIRVLANKAKLGRPKAKFSRKVAAVWGQPVEGALAQIDANAGAIAKAIAAGFASASAKMPPV